MSRSGDFRGDNGQTDRRTDRQTDYFTPAYARGVIKLMVEVGVAVQKQYTNKGSRLGIIRQGRT